MRLIESHNVLQNMVVCAVDSNIILSQDYLIWPLSKVEGMILFGRAKLDFFLHSDYIIFHHKIMIATRSWNDVLFLQYSGQIDSLQNIGNTLCILITRVLSYSKYQPGAVTLSCKQRSSSTPLDSPSERLTSMTESPKNVRREQQIIMREEKCQSATLHFITCSVQKVRQ